MKRRLVSGMALAILTGGALAQAATPLPGAPAAPDASLAQTPTPPGAPAAPDASLVQTPTPPGAPAAPDASLVRTPTPPGGATAPNAGAQRRPLPPTRTPVDGMATSVRAPPPPPPGAPDAMMDDASGPPPPPPGPRGGPDTRRPPPPSPSRAAHLHLEHGDTALDVKCAEDAPMKACGDLALQLLDKLQAIPNVTALKP